MVTRLPALVLAALGLTIVWLVGSDAIHLYVHERSALLVTLTGPLLVLLAVLVIGRSWPGHLDRAGLLMLACPIVVALLLPGRPLGATAFALHQGTTERVQSRLPELPTGWSVGAIEFDLRRLGELGARDPLLSGLDGQRATLLGFVYRPPNLPADQFVVGRFIIRCCTADAVPLSIPVRFAGAAELPTDTWVEVTGTIRRIDGQALSAPIVEADSVTVVPVPSRPYLSS